VLEDVRREVVEARNMTIKTDNALKTLHAELKLIATQQDTFHKRTWFATFGAYLGFVGLCVAGVIAITQARTSGERADKERLEKQLAEANTALETERAQHTALAGAERSAAEVYKMMTRLPGDERLKGLDALARVDQAKLSPFAKVVLADRAELLRKEVGAGILEKGKNSFRKQEYGAAIEELNRYLQLDQDGADSYEASFFLGNSYFQLRKFDEAVKPLVRFVDGDKKARLRDFAMLLLMQCYDVTGKKELANEVAKDAVAAFPASDYRAQFLNRLQKKDAPPEAPAPAPVAPPAAQKPAPVPAPAPAPPPAAPAGPPAAQKPGAPPPPAPAPPKKP
jgi:tetratricopeptide (TPR) repeat protein